MTASPPPPRAPQPGVLRPRFDARRNPFYKNEKKTAEPHLLHTFPEDFYGQEIRVVVCGYLRPETSFPSLDALIAAIQTDIRLAKERLEGEEGEARKNDPFLKPQ